eukprot:CAMPEP_0185762820 /NCGR_PEP_ID=MMETSP1174-20130828/21791_1 /TAXON_ID=35687 /ORGANISM="Dictyocha speculum, Strain CCMP1381" /LENGTH=324 /DNA_ID=CAMNT_0028444665 /DNA_START=41 /DNA_END=1015 /DNA_ORIENTATION=-
MVSMYFFWAILPGVSSMALNGLPSAITQASRSPVGRITLSVELATANDADEKEVSELSQLCRVKAKTSCIFVKELEMLKIIVGEQQTAIGNFPGPVPVLYEPSGSSDTYVAEVAAAAAAGADAFVIPVGEMMTSETDGIIMPESDVVSAADGKLELIPELKLAGSVSEDELLGALDTIRHSVAFDTVILSCDFPTAPSLPKELVKSTTVIGRVSVDPGAGQLSEAVQTFEKCGYNGAVISSTCVPRMIGVVGSGAYWQAALTSLKKRSSSKFAGVRTRVSTKWSGDAAPTAWLEYFQEAADTSGWLDSGAEEVIDSDGGDWKGF